MLYKTITMGLLEEHSIYPQLCKERRALATMNALSHELEQSHKHHLSMLKGDPMQINSEAMELALADLQDLLQTFFQPDTSEASVSQ